MIDNYKFCGDCEFLNFTEAEQEAEKMMFKNKTKHRCNKYRSQLYHNGFQPEIMKCEECLYKKKVSKYNFIEMN